MTIDELIERLEELRDFEDAGHWEIKIAQQPGYPLVGILDAFTWNTDKQEAFLASASPQEYGTETMWHDGENLGDYDND